MTDKEQQAVSTARSMSASEARAIFDQEIREQLDPEKRVSMELCREYFTNPTFREWLELEVARINGVT